MIKKYKDELDNIIKLFLLKVQNLNENSEISNITIWNLANELDEKVDELLYKLIDDLTAIFEANKKEIISATEALKRNIREQRRS